MTQSFDEWVKKDYPHLIGNQGQTLSICMGFAKQGYEAGAQSKQAEIDEYKEVASSMEDAYIREKSKVDELRKRIDDLDKQLFVQKGLNRFLKGKSNDH